MLENKRVNVFDRGFTLIELVIIIVVVGILAAAALPRFASLNNQAFLSAHKKFAGDFKAAIGIVHVAWIAAGMPNPGGNGTAVVTLESTGINVSANPAAGFGGWPYGWNNLANAYAPGCATTVSQVLSNPPEVQTSAGSCTQPICYVVTCALNGVSPFDPVCTFTLNGTAHTIVYYTASGSVVVN